MNAHTLVFDKLIYLDRLKGAGVSDEVARAHADGLDQALRESIATKADLQEMESRLNAKFDASADALSKRIDSVDKRVDSLDAKIDTVAARLDAKIETVAERLDAKIDTAAARVETKIAEAQVTTTRWMIGTFIALGGLFWAIVKYSH